MSRPVRVVGSPVRWGWVVALAAIVSLSLQPAAVRAASVAGCANGWTQLRPVRLPLISQTVAVDTTEPTSTWLVGTTALGHPAMTQHGRRRSWVVTPNDAGGALLYGVLGAGPSDAWAVGVDAVVGGTALVERWDGHRWGRSSLPPTGESWLYGIAGSGVDGVWAAGYRMDPTFGYRTLIEHWDGVAWRIVDSPDEGAFNVLFGVDATAPADAWAVGYVDTPGTVPMQSLVLRWDGGRWTRASSPNPGTLQNILRGVVGVTADDAWAVGDYHGEFDSGPLIEHWDGSSWAVVAGPPVLFGSLSDVAAVSSSDVWAVGGETVEHWDGSAWSLDSSLPPSPPGQERDLTSVDALPNGAVVAAGTLLDQETGTTVPEVLARCG